MQKKNLWLSLEQFLVPGIVLLILLVYTYVRFFALPYAGLQYSASGEILDVFTPLDGLVQRGERLTEVNGVTLAEYSQDLVTPLFKDVGPGDLVRLNIQGEQGERWVSYHSPGFNTSEFISRLFNTWWLSFIFWISGTIIYFHVRPRDVRWKLLVAFSYLTAIWLIAGSLSRTIIFYSPLVFRAAIWLCAPVYVHLHWNFPSPFRKIPTVVWGGLYIASVALSLLQLLSRVPADWYIYALALSVLISLLLLTVRFFINPASRREVALLLGAFAIALLPSVALGLASTLGTTSGTMNAGVLVSLIAWPGAYFYVVYRRQLGGLELRANRLISIYLFFVLLFTVALIMVAIISPLLQNPEQVVLAILVTGLLVSLFNVFAFERFQRFVEQHLLKIPQPPEGLQQAFASQISTSLTRQHLGQTLQQQVLPGLLIRKSALLHFEGRTPARQVIYVQGVELADLPDSSIQQDLLASGPRPTSDVAPAWVQLAIPVRAGNQAIGLWLLGRKDPDDYYSYLEERMLQSLADQMAIALVNIQQADRLRALHQRDIDNQEERRAFMARELHDDVLGGISELVSLAKRPDAAAELDQREKKLSDSVRQLIYRLRPAMLDFGLYRALTELVDNLTQRLGDSVQVSLMVPESIQMYEGHVAEHAYRIVQLAAENAIRHAKPEFINISGALTPTRIELLIEDDGGGFDLEGTSLPDLLRAGHFGLASMNERAALIGAQLSIHSAPGEGTQVHLVWQREVEPM